MKSDNIDMTFCEIEVYVKDAMFSGLSPMFANYEDANSGSKVINVKIKLQGTNSKGGIMYNAIDPKFTYESLVVEPIDSMYAKITHFYAKDGQTYAKLVVASAGIVDYIKGEVILSTINITSTQKSNNIIEIQAFPESNDVIGLKDLYLSFAVGDSAINMVKDTITSGEQISGVGYKVTSSYANGALVRG